jgi:hypothetical protein
MAIATGGIAIGGVAAGAIANSSRRFKVETTPRRSHSVRVFLQFLMRCLGVATATKTVRFGSNQDIRVWSLECPAPVNVTLGVSVEVRANSQLHSASAIGCIFPRSCVLCDCSKEQIARNLFMAKIEARVRRGCAKRLQPVSDPVYPL